MSEAAAMADSDAATHEEHDWPAQGVRQRLGSRIERRVLRSAVDMLDERGTDLDSIERKLVEREQNLAERLSAAEAEEAELSHRERRLAEIGATDLDATRRIDHLIRELDQTESTAAAYLAKADAKVNDAEQKARELADRVRRLEEAEHKRVCPPRTSPAASRPCGAASTRSASRTSGCASASRRSARRSTR